MCELGGRHRGRHADVFLLLFLQFNILCFYCDFHCGKSREMSLPNMGLRTQHSMVNETLWSEL